MTSVTSIATDVKAALGTDLTKELQRLKPLEGKWGSRAIQTVQNELNRLVNIFKTGKFSTEAQVCVRLDKAVKKLETKMKQEHKMIEQAGGKGKIELVKQDIEFRQSVDKLASQMTKLLDKFSERKGKPTKEYLTFSKDLRELRYLNEKELKADEKILDSLTPRQAVMRQVPEPKAKVVGEEVTLVRKGRGQIVVPPRVQLAKALHEAIIRAQKSGPRFGENVSRETLQGLKELLESDPETLAQKPEKLIKSARSATHEIRGAFVLTRQPVPEEISAALRSVEKQADELEKSERKVKPQDKLASDLPRLIRDAYQKHDLRSQLTEEQRSELKELLTADLKPPQEPEEAARLGKKAVDLIAHGFRQHGRSIPAELEDRLSDLEELLSKLPILAKEIKEERPSEIVARDLPGIVRDAFSVPGGIEGQLKAEDKAFLEKLKDAEAVRKMPLKTLSESTRRAIPLLQRAVMASYGDIPPDLMKRMTDINRQAGTLVGFEKGRAERARVQLTEAERSRATNMARQVKTEGQNALIKAITHAREASKTMHQRGALGRIFLGDSPENRRLDELRDKEPFRFSSKDAEEALVLLRKGFGDDESKIPQKVSIALKVLETHVEKMREIESPDWQDQFRTQVRL